MHIFFDQASETPKIVTYFSVCEHNIILNYCFVCSFSQCQRGEDLGVVVDIIPLALFVERRYLAKLNGETEEEGTNVTHILRLASQFDLSQLSEKNRDEVNAVEVG